MNEKQIAHDQRKTWIQANYINYDPTFYYKWRDQQKLNDLKCENCRLSKEFSDIFTQDTDDDFSLETTISHTDLFKDLEIKELNCKLCSNIWCNFTLEMLKEYSTKQFKIFGINHEFEINTFIVKVIKGVHIKKPICIKIMIKPQFSIIDETGPNLGKKLIYYNKMENIQCNNSDFKLDEFKIRMNYQAQFRMNSPFKVK